MQPYKELQPNFKTSNTQNCQKIELCGSRTTKDLKDPHSSRRVGGVETSGQTVWHGKVAAAAAVVEWMVPHSCMVDKNCEGYPGS